MKRVGIILLVAVAWVLSAPLLRSTPILIGPSAAFADPAATDTPDPTPVDILAGAAGPTCVSVPVLSSGGSQGKCGPGEIEIPNDQPGGPIITYLKLYLKLINGLVATIIMLVVVLGGFQYIISAGDPTRIKSAKKRLTSAFIALFLYLGMFAILNFIVPGGILG